MTTITDGRAFLDGLILEDDFQGNIIKTAKAAGWTYYHTYNSKRSVQGFPDLVLVRAGRLIFAELKKQRGTVSPYQRVWLQVLGLVVQALDIAGAHGIVSVYLWRPSDWPEIEAILTARA